MLHRVRAKLHGLLRPHRHEIAAVTASLDALALELRSLNAAGMDEYRTGLDALRAELDRAIAIVAERQDGFEQHIRAWVPEYINGLRDHLEVHAGEAVDNATGSIKTRLRRLERSATTQPVAPPPRNGADDANPPTGAVEIGSVANPPTGAAPGEGGDVGDLGLDYSVFEDELRGSPEHVKALEAVHVETVSGFGAPELAVLDVGCGRGELLQLLAEAGMACRGVDLNPVSVAECLEAGLDVVGGDAVAYLRSLEPGSLRAVCGMHIVEHMTSQQRTALFLAAFDALAVGGGIILETPNPENLRVGSNSFWLDPTHLRPIPPQLLEFQVAQAGFDDVEIQRLHPSDDALDVPDDADAFVAALGAFVNRLITGPMDYAVVGRKLSA